MPRLERTHFVHHKAHDMFALVADIEKYPEFLPMCDDLVIRDKREKDGKTLLIADMSIAYKAIRENFTSQVLLKPDDLIIEAQYIDGPFKHLDNSWYFSDLDRQNIGNYQSRIDFYLDYAFKNMALGLLMGAMFERVFVNFTQNFEDRADTIYS